MNITKKKEEFPTYENVEYREILVEDIVASELVSEQKSGSKYEAALISQVATFNGKKLTMEDILRMRSTDFFLLKDSVLYQGQLTELVKQYLSSPQEPELTTEA